LKWAKRYSRQYGWPQYRTPQKDAVRHLVKMADADEGTVNVTLKMPAT
jgi:hypothetical protein